MLRVTLTFDLAPYYLIDS